MSWNHASGSAACGLSQGSQANLVCDQDLGQERSLGERRAPDGRGAHELRWGKGGAGGATARSPQFGPALVPDAIQTPSRVRLPAASGRLGSARMSGDQCSSRSGFGRKGPSRARRPDQTLTRSATDAFGRLVRSSGSDQRRFAEMRVPERSGGRKSGSGRGRRLRRARSLDEDVPTGLGEPGHGEGMRATARAGGARRCCRCGRRGGPRPTSRRRRGGRGTPRRRSRGGCRGCRPRAARPRRGRRC
jgi:hypothetical protein